MELDASAGTRFVIGEIRRVNTMQGEHRSLMVSEQECSVRDGQERADDLLLNAKGAREDWVSMCVIYWAVMAILNALRSPPSIERSPIPCQPEGLSCAQHFAWRLPPVP
jgi:hypothetical protein